MAEPTAQGEAGDTKAGKRVRGAFPRMPLSKVLELPEAVFQLGEGEQVRRVLVFDHLKKSAESSTSRALVIASSAGYGLTAGGKEAVYLDLTERGRKLVRAKGDRARREAIYDVLFSNELFSGFVDRFKDRGIPLDDVAVEYLKNAHGLAQADAESAWSVFKENILDYGLYQELSGKRVVVSREDASKRMPPEAEAKAASDAIPAPPGDDASPGVVHSAAHQLRRHSQAHVAPQFHFNIQVVLPENASAETYENIFRSIGTHLLGRDTTE